MPDIKLGPSGTETTLPAINWISGSPPDLPVALKKNIDKATMLDGSVRVNIKTNHQRTFTISWAKLEEHQIEIIDDIVALNQALRYQNNWVDSTWRWVTVGSWDWSPLQSTFVSTPYFQATLTLEEVGG